MALQPGQKITAILLVAFGAVGIIWLVHDIVTGNADWRVLTGLGLLFIYNVFYAPWRLAAKTPSGDAIENAPPPKSD